MNRSDLEGHLAAGRSLERIGELEGKHPSTVSYWLKKHGLVAVGRARHAPNAKLDVGRLRALIDSGATIRSIAVEMGVGYSTVRHWMVRSGLKTGRMQDRARFNEARRFGLDAVDAPCHRHGSTKHIRRTDGVYRCMRCASASVARRRRKVKRILVAEAGGACVICGYDRCVAALQFHHLDPAQKEFVVSLRGVTRSIAELRREAAKCALLCANCHAEVERGMAEVPLRA